MRYMLLLMVDDSLWPTFPAEMQRAGLAAYQAYTLELETAGVLVLNGRLAPSAEAATVRTKGGKVVPMDGPFAETKEHVAGFYVIEAPGRAAALDWAARCPAADHGIVEVREIC